jgi:hypothetical protein
MQQSSEVFYAIRADMLQAGEVIQLNFAGNKKKSYQIMRMNMFAV